MSLALKNGLIINGIVNQKEVIRDLLIIDGLIAEVGTDLKGDFSIDLKGAVVVPGLFDIWSHFCEPGFEHKEDIDTGLSAARAGGFTDVACLPNTQPIVDSKSQLRFIVKAASEHPISIHPYACVSREGKNEVISEMQDLYRHGAVAFTGGIEPIANSELLLKSLQYAQSFGGLVVNRPVDKDLARFGQMHEGYVSTSLGMKGIPSLAEKIAVERDLSLLEYTGGRLHLSGISSKESLELIRNAKKKGLQISCDVPIHNLIFVEEDLLSYDSNLKLDPPLRSKEDRAALIEAVADDTVDCISSYHIPQDVESKELEFDLSEPGMISLQTFVPQLLRLTDRIPMSKIFHKVSNAPRMLFGLEPIMIERGAEARLTIIDIGKSWRFDEESNLSKSRNSVLLNTQQIGKAIGMVLGNEYYSMD